MSNHVHFRITKKEVQAALHAELLQFHPAARELLDEVVPRFIAEYAVETLPEIPPGAMGLMVMGYAVRKTDVNLLKVFLSGLTLGVVASVGSSTLASAKVGIASALLELLNDIRSKGVRLDARKARILGILVANVREPSQAGMTLEEIVEIIRRHTPNHPAELVEQDLKLLARHPTPGGGTTELVSQDALGRWRPHV